MIPRKNESWRPAQPTERAHARRAQTGRTGGRISDLRASQGGGVAARRLRAPKKLPAIIAGSAV